MIIGLYPPTRQQGEIIKTLNELPEGVELIDYNEFYRLYKKDLVYYIYKIKNPVSPLDQILNENKNETIN